MGFLGADQGWKAEEKNDQDNSTNEGAIVIGEQHRLQ
jgi:hypothetical protein